MKLLSFLDKLLTHAPLHCASRPVVAVHLVRQSSNAPTARHIRRAGRVAALEVWEERVVVFLWRSVVEERFRNVN